MAERTCLREIGDQTGDSRTLNARIQRRKVDRALDRRENLERTDWFALRCSPPKNTPESPEIGDRTA